MNEKIIYISGNKLNVIHSNKVCELSSQVYQRYIKNTNEIKEKNKWKNSGEGTIFTGGYDFEQFMENESIYKISGAAPSDKQDKFIYSSIINDLSCIYSKDYTDDSQTETLIFSDKNTSIQDINYKSNKILASISNETIEYHIALFDMDVTGYTFLTEGDTIDENPSWSKTNNNIIYYNCKGIGRDSNGNITGYSPRYICKLNLLEGSVDELMMSDSFEYIKPKEDSSGNLYYIKLPFKAGKHHSLKLSDIILAPFRLLRGIFGFLDIFTQRYSGQSLKSKGSNPAKSNVKSPKDIFIEGNLINVEKSLKQSQSSGEKYPGFAPKSWELRRLGTDGNDTCIKNGILDYDLAGDGNVVYSNGHYIVKIENSGEETLAAKANLVTRVTVI